jgi:hypothetical protein
MIYHHLQKDGKLQRWRGYQKTVVNELAFLCFFSLLCFALAISFFYGRIQILTAVTLKMMWRLVDWQKFPDIS